MYLVPQSLWSLDLAHQMGGSAAWGRWYQGFLYVSSCTQRLSQVSLLSNCPAILSTFYFLLLLRTSLDFVVLRALIFWTIV